MLRLPVTVAVAIALLALPALAEDPCAAEAMRLCNKARGDIALLGCLRNQEKELSPACRGSLHELYGIAVEYGKDCEADAAKLCKDVPRGEGRLARCLWENESFVSQSCQGAINKVRLVQSGIQAGCAEDVGRFCKDVPQGAGRIIGCLRRNEKELSGNCKDVLKKLP